MRHDHDARRPAGGRRAVGLLRCALAAAFAAGVAATRGPALAADPGAPQDVLQEAQTPAAVLSPTNAFPLPGAPQEKGIAAGAAAALSPTNVPPLPVAPPAEGITAGAAAAPFIPASGLVLDETADDLITVGPVRQKLYEALLNVQEQDYALAIPKLEWVLREDPSQMLAWQSLGWSYWGMDRKDDALKLWERLQALAPNEPMSYNCLAMAASESGDNSRAEKLYRRSLELDPGQDDIRFDYYKVLVWQGKLDDAIPGLRDLLARDPGRTDVRKLLAQALIAPHNYEQALPHWTLLCEQFPDNTEFALSLAINLLLLGDVESAADEAQRVLEMDTENREASRILAEIAEFSNEPEKAAAELRKRIDRTEDKVVKSALLLRLAVLLRDLNAINPAKYPVAQGIDAARESADSNPFFVPAHLFLGEMLVMDRQYSAAQKVFEHVLKEFNRDNRRAKMGLFEISIATGKFDEAELRLKDMLSRFDPYDPYRYALLARLEFERGNVFDAMKMLDRLEEEGARGAVRVLLYHGLSESEWTADTSVRRLREHLSALRAAGFRFIAMDEIPAYFKSLEGKRAEDTRPFISRMWHWVKYAFTGEGSPKPPALREYSPEKVACVTFDDARNNSLFFGTPVAEEMNASFGMFIPECNISRNIIYAASWEELRRYYKTGNWSFGSHLMDASIPGPVDEEGHIVYPLPNQMWDPERNRTETLRSYLGRIKREFKDSREIIVRELGMESNDCRTMSFPFGELGQETASNIRNMDNVAHTILNESSKNYDIGFVQSRYGYAVNGDNPLLYQRYEPRHRDNGQDVVRHAMENHPVFLARRMRAEFAALSGKPYLAERMIKELERDGYPETSLEKLKNYVRGRLAGQIEEPRKATGESKREGRWLALEHPFVGVDFDTERDNSAIDQWHLTGRAGININPKLTVEILGGIGSIEHTITVNTNFSMETVKVTTNRVITTSIINGSNYFSDSTEITYQQVTVSTNLSYKEKFQADEEAAGLRMNLRMAAGSLLFFELRQRTFTAKGQDTWRSTVTNINGNVVTNIGPATFTEESEIVGALEFQCKPVIALDVAVRYEHDVMPSAHDIITYDKGAIRGVWRATDWWNIEGNAAYSFLSDTNTALQIGVMTDWLVSEKQGVYLGMLYQFNTVEDDSVEYWSPYWRQRYALTARVQRSYGDSFTRVRALVGWNKEGLRPEETRSNPYAEESGWSPMVGVEGSVRRNLFRHIDIHGDFGVSFLQDYTEYRLNVGLVFDFEGKR